MTQAELSDAHERAKARDIPAHRAYGDRFQAAMARLVNPAEVQARILNLQIIARATTAALESGERLPADVVQRLNAALTAFAPRVSAEGFDASAGVTVYSVAALQAMNDLANQAEIRICANERCGQTFTRQRGRAEFGEHRTKGVMYCDKSCAQAQAQRAHRRRIKLEKADKQ